MYPTHGEVIAEPKNETEILYSRNNKRQTRDSKMNETKPKKSVSRNVVIALGIICIIFASGLAVTLITLNCEYSRAANLQGQVNDLNNIAILNKTEVLVYNWTSSIGPNKTITSLPFDVPFSGNLEVEGAVQPPNLNISRVGAVWGNLTWTVYYRDSYYPTDIYPYEVSENAHLGFVEEDYFQMYFPIVSFGPSYTPSSSATLTIGNGDPSLTLAVNITITLQY